MTDIPVILTIPAGIMAGEWIRRKDQRPRHRTDHSFARDRPAVVIRADLTDANLIRADLTDANLTGAFAVGAVFPAGYVASTQPDPNPDSSSGPPPAL
jgi:Pentapeptide repeats (8 copies)